ncbi:MAG: hypothetical protein JWR22_372 [Herminiimonas sp.]|nr:hypothetical protein [Herminiimonas sp.]
MNPTRLAALHDPQQGFDVAVVIPTLLRPQLRRAVESVFRQDLPGKVQILVGIDRHEGDAAMLHALKLATPPHMHLSIFDPGYSTSSRHGGQHSCAYGGALRTALSYLANSRRIAYLDDDDWWAPDHLSAMVAALNGHAWCWTLRHYAAPGSDDALCIDEWESVGPDAGIYLESWGGHVAPSCLMLDAQRCHLVMTAWSTGVTANGGGEDRLVFRLLRQIDDQGGTTGRATSFATMLPGDKAHAFRLACLRKNGVAVPASLQPSLTAGTAQPTT